MFKKSDSDCNIHSQLSGIISHSEDEETCDAAVSRNLHTSMSDEDDILKTKNSKRNNRIIDSSSEEDIDINPGEDSIVINKKISHSEDEETCDSDVSRSLNTSMSDEDDILKTKNSKRSNRIIDSSSEEDLDINPGEDSVVINKTIPTKDNIIIPDSSSEEHHDATLLEVDSTSDENNCEGNNLIKSNPRDDEKKDYYAKFNTTREIPTFISSSSEDDDVIEGSDDEFTKTKTTKQPLLRDFIKPKIISVTNSPEVIKVSSKQYEEQKQKVMRLESDLQTTLNLLKTINLQHLPDQGQSLKNRQQHLEMKQVEEVQKLSKMEISEITETFSIVRPNQPKLLSWNEIEQTAGRVQPKTHGKKAMSTYNTQKVITMDKLQQLHGSLQNCPKESDLGEPPRGLTVELMPHQLRALSWLTWRENQKPSGGILADDMGLGKTLTMISLMLKSKEIEKEEDSDNEDSENQATKTYPGNTLIICPASLIKQWSGELERRTTRGLASYSLYHGPRREKKPKRLAEPDMVITTYSIVNNECEKKGTIFRVKWRRIIIDEAHQIRNHKSQTSDAVCRLSAKSRWALTGTPVHNKELDMYALLKFIRCSPFDDVNVWKRWVGDKSTGGTERLHTVISSLMLRRTKEELIEKKLLNALPERKWELIPVQLTENERAVYNKILIFSRTLFAQFLHQQAEKKDDNRDLIVGLQDNGPNHEYFQMRQKLLRLNKLRDIKQHEILVLLLRLRQICNHPSLITGMLHEDMELMGDDEASAHKVDALDLLTQLNKLAIEDNEEPVGSIAAGASIEEAPTLKDVVKNVLNPSDPVFSKTRASSKIKAVLKVLKSKVLNTEDKVIIVSQWPSFLNLIAHNLREEHLKFHQLDGTVPVPHRMEMVDRFNNPRDNTRILLLSLTAGGVGLNLIGANHLILLDLHWNPQLENQAQDRIYRIGQEKSVFIYKFMAADTIEKRILDLQEKKLDIANSMLTGTVHATTNKLSLQDLKLLFDL